MVVRRGKILGAHDVSNKWLWSVARVRGVSASFIALLLGGWILYHHNELFRTPAWVELPAWVGWPILIGGVLGVAGLCFRRRLLSLASCMVGVVWFGWMLAFLGYANFTDSPNVGMWFALYGLLEYIYRFVLLAIPPGPGEEYGRGW